MYSKPSGIVTLLSDFGSCDPYVGIMKGMVKRANARAEILDFCHEVPAQDIETGAFFTGAALGRFPAGTVHVAVVDPGVGTARDALAVFAAECYWIAPDNGLLAAVFGADPRAEVRRVDPSRLQLRVESNTFHGRDVFAPLAGMLSGGRYGFAAVGARIPILQATQLPSDASPRVLLVDGFGNLITNVSGERLHPATVVEIGTRRVQCGRTYADVAPGELLALVNSYGLVEIAARDARANELVGVGRGARVVVAEA